MISTSCKARSMSSLKKLHEGGRTMGGETDEGGGVLTLNVEEMKLCFPEPRNGDQGGTDEGAQGLLLFP